MTETTITFTPKAQLRKGLCLLGKGFSLTGKALAKMFDNSIHRYPYAYVFIILLVATITACINIGQARAERDRLNKEYYELQKKVSQLPEGMLTETE